MRLFLDTADADGARELARWGTFAGITTNPLLLARAHTTADVAIPRLAEAVPGEIFAQARGTTADALCADAQRLAALAPGRLVVKIPATPAGLIAIHMLGDLRIPTAATAVFRAAQALLAARAGAIYTIPFWHRIGERGGDPARETALAVQACERLYASGVRTRVLVASMRNPDQVMAAFAAGAHAVTVSLEVGRALVDDPGTAAAVAQFEQAQGDE
jgi:TalC/MipB family fructose-6-phosphate aldolase